MPHSHSYYTSTGSLQSGILDWGPMCRHTLPHTRQVHKATVLYTGECEAIHIAVYAHGATSREEGIHQLGVVSYCGL